MQSGNRKLAILIVDHLGLSLVKAICLFCFPCPVIGQAARDEWIAAFIKIITVANLYLCSFYTQKTTFLNWQCLEFLDNTKSDF